MSLYSYSLCPRSSSSKSPGEGVTQELLSPAFSYEIPAFDGVIIQDVELTLDLVTAHTSLPTVQPKCPEERRVCLVCVCSPTSLTGATPL